MSKKGIACSHIEIDGVPYPRARATLYDGLTADTALATVTMAADDAAPDIEAGQTVTLSLQGETPLPYPTEGLHAEVKECTFAPDGERRYCLLAHHEKVEMGGTASVLLHLLSECLLLDMAVALLKFLSGPSPVERAESDARRRDPEKR